ncbi:CDP-alcohol phosphatidyltransferase family protein [Candidatus Parcubacteria bacterium]|nr:CDP-alcohol phosphatidyltransferase family protein [Candidatus Parcubacteria bacterium]
MFKKDFEKTDKLFWHDKLMSKTFLKLIPKKIYPNHITMFRFLTTPIVVYLMISKQYQVGMIAFLIVAFSDALDGSLARVRNQITTWGKIYDPVADKILISSMVFIIVFKYIDPLTAYLIISIEVIIIFVAWFRLKKGYKVQANIWGKIKMCLQVLGVFVLLLAIVFNIAELFPFASGTLYLAIAFAIVSLLTYGI